MIRFRKLSILLSLFSFSLAGCSNSLQNSSQDGGGGNDDPTPIHFTYKDDEGADDNDYLFYSDDYFREPSTKYNPHLATLSIYMSKYSQNPGDPDNAEDYDWYTNQPRRVMSFYQAIGFAQDYNALVNYDYISRTRFDSIGIAVAARKVDDFTVIASTVRSGGYFNEWENNVFLGDGTKSDYMHEGWYNAANKVIEFINYYIFTQNITGKIKLWVSGFSRGGATMNLTAGLLDNKIKNLGSDKVFYNVTLEREDLYAYTFEAPQGANIYSTTVEFPRSSLYNNIFNVINQNDIVTKVAMGGMGFTRFGIDKFITTGFFDPTNFLANRYVVRELYGVSNDWFCDDLQMYTIPGGLASLITDVFNIPGLVTDVLDAVIEAKAFDNLPDWIQKDDDKATYDPNILLTLVLDEGVSQMGQDSRTFYTENIQQFARKLILLLMGDDKSPDKPTLQEFFIKLLFQSFAYYLFSDESVVISWDEIEGITPDMVATILSLVINIYNEIPNEILSLAINMEHMFDNHSTAINVCHLQAQDSYYINKFNIDHPELDTPLTVVPLMKNASICRIKLENFNEAHLQDLRNPGQYPIDIMGHDVGESSIANVDPGYAAGYYHFSPSHERLELFFSSYPNFELEYMSNYVETVSHDLKVTYYFYPTNSTFKDADKYYRYTDVWYSCDDHSGDDGPYTKDFVRGDSLLPPPDDLTGTTWWIYRLVSDSDTKHINFTSNGRNYTSFTVDTVEAYGEEVWCIFYDDNPVALMELDGSNFFFYDDNDRFVTITGGDDARGGKLIDWFYEDAYIIR